ncbi:ATP-binding protein [Alteromonas sp. C1M14]|uniref:ATP-binding protein n=1 Tax=Alteromonas sp. C1M14 TaxID=2841567 RepID=UPI001C08781A|nr:ATP-binding protein [Alteromonas sp. C1M14]MBU2979438.1 GAF domain-containing protein [Alteromonas sp. C1M14]
MMNVVYSRNIPQIETGQLDTSLIYGKCLEMVLESAPLAKVTERFLRHVEAKLPHYQLAVMQLVQQTQTLSVLAAPSLSASQLDAIDHVVISQQTTPCAVVAQSKQPLYIENITAYPKWRTFSATLPQSRAINFWSFPLLHDNHCIGTLMVTGPYQQASELTSLEPFEQVCQQLTKLFAYAESQQEKARTQWALEKKAKRHETQIASLTASCERLFSQLAQLESAQLTHPVPPSLRLATTHLLGDIRSMLDMSNSLNGFLHVIATQASQGLGNKTPDHKLQQKLRQSANRGIAENTLLSVNLHNRLQTFERLLNDIAENPVRTINIAETLMPILQSVTSLPSTNAMGCITVDSELTAMLPVGTFTQVIFELVSNTVRHAYINSNHCQFWITVALTRRGNTTMMKIVIEDHGRGIGKNTDDNGIGPTLTDDFASHKKGLATCARLVKQKLGGSIHYDNANSAGSRFYLYFPLPR